MTIEKKTQFTKNILIKLFNKEKEFISNLFKIAGIPSHNSSSEEDCVYIKEEKLNNEDRMKNHRVKNYQELCERLNKLKKNKDYSIKNKIAKKNLSRKIKRKNRKNERNKNIKLDKIKEVKNEKLIQSEEDSKFDKTTENKLIKPVFNSQGKMVFSKFDFTESGIPQDKTKGEKNPKKILETLKKQKETITELKERGDKKMASHITDKIVWKNALAKAEGQKIKDDSLLLKKTIKNKEQKKKQSAKKWEKKLETVKKSKEDKQKKRESNILKRKQDKKKKNIKKAIKKGRIIS